MFILIHKCESSSRRSIGAFSITVIVKLKTSWRFVSSSRHYISRAGTLLVLLNRNIRGNEKTLYREENELDTLSWERTHSVQRQRGDMSCVLSLLKLWRCTFNLIFRFTLFYILCCVQFNRICFLFCVDVCCAVLGKIAILVPSWNTLSQFA